MSPTNEMLLGTVILGVLAFLAVIFSHQSNSRRRLIQVLPTSKVQGVFLGLVELKGTAETSRPFQSYLTGQACVLYEWTVHENWQRTVQQTYTDEQGKRRTRTVTETGSTLIAQGGETSQFYVKDDSGHLLLHPQGAEIRPATLLSRTCTPGDPLYFSRGPHLAIPHSTGVRNFFEAGIRLHEKVFVIGKARERKDIVAPEIAEEKSAPLFLLTTESEAQVLGRLGRSMGFRAIIGLILAAAGGCLLAGPDPAPFRVPYALIGLALAAALWSLSWLWMVYNSLVDARNRVRQGYSQIEVQLARRHTLIPQLISCVEALKTHEHEVHTIIARLRSRSMEDKVETAHGTRQDIHLLAEAYPQLRSDAAFTNLAQELINTEQRIALSRSYFNDVATGYNNRIMVFPDSLLAGIGAFKPQPLLEVSEFDRADVTVNFQS